VKVKKAMIRIKPSNMNEQPQNQPSTPTMPNRRGRMRLSSDRIAFQQSPSPAQPNQLISPRQSAPIT